MANREFVMLSHALKLNEINNFSLGNWFLSEKLDGMRAIWLPDTIGHLVRSLPFANLDKDRTGAGDRHSTGLWSRYAKPIWAPAWYTESFPRDKILDGELWTGRREFQRLTSIVKQGTPGPEWQDVQFRVFDSPSPQAVYQDGKIHNGQLKKHFRGVWEWCQRELAYDYQVHGRTFDHTWFQVLRHLDTDKFLKTHPQLQLPYSHQDAVKVVASKLEEVLQEGGEGLVVRSYNSVWEPVRSKLVLKIKSELEEDGVVIGHTDGQGRLEGMMGSLQIRSTINERVVEFGLSGFSDEERRSSGTLFPVGTVVSFLYRDLTEDGVPREARFLRVRTDL